MAPSSGRYFLAISHPRAYIGTIPGWLTISVGVLFNGLLFLIGLFTVGMHEATGEVLPRFLVSAEAEASVGEKISPWRRIQAAFRPSGRRRQLMAYIITDQADLVAKKILSEMARGVTALQGKGMYTGKEHSVLMCALTVTEVVQLKSLVKKEDPNAFVIVTPVQEVLGKGFSPLSGEG